MIHKTSITLVYRIAAILLISLGSTTSSLAQTNTDLSVIEAARALGLPRCKTPANS